MAAGVPKAATLEMTRELAGSCGVEGRDHLILINYGCKPQVLNITNTQSREQYA